MSQEIIISRDRIEALTNALLSVLKVESFYQFKILIDDNRILIIPLVQEIEIKL